jgi:hypothetical protein
MKIDRKTETDTTCCGSSFNYFLVCRESFTAMAAFTPTTDHHPIHWPRVNDTHTYAPAFLAADAA